MARIEVIEDRDVDGNLLSEEVVIHPEPSFEEAAAAAGRLTVVDRLDTLPDATVAEVAPLFDDWQPGQQVEVGDVREWDGTLVKCIQAHTTQADWTPPATPSLWVVYRQDSGDVPLAWMPGLELTTTDQVTHDGVTYDVLQAHTSQEGWTPPATPALFAPAT